MNRAGVHGLSNYHRAVQRVNKKDVRKRLTVAPVALYDIGMAKRKRPSQPELFAPSGELRPKRTKMIGLRVTDEEERRMKIAAKGERRSVAQLLREALKSYLAA